MGDFEKFVGEVVVSIVLFASSICFAFLCAWGLIRAINWVAS